MQQPQQPYTTGTGGYQYYGQGGGQNQPAARGPSPPQMGRSDSGNSLNAQQAARPGQGSPPPAFDPNIDLIQVLTPAQKQQLNQMLAQMLAEQLPKQQQQDLQMPPPAPSAASQAHSVEESISQLKPEQVAYLRHCLQQHQATAPTPTPPQPVSEPGSERSSSTKSSQEDPRNLIVNYIPTPVTDSELRALFEQFGELESARVILDRVTQHPKGYGFVKYKKATCAREAMEKMNGFEIHNKRLKVTMAKGPQNAAISQHTARLQQYVSMQSVPQPTQAQVSAPPPQTIPQHQQNVEPVRLPPREGALQYIVLDGHMQPMFSGGVMPQRQQPDPRVFQQQGPVFLTPTADPMYQDSARFSMASSQGTTSFGISSVPQSQTSFQNYQQQPQYPL